MKQRYFRSARSGAAVFLVAMLSFSFVTMTKTCFSSAMVFIVSEGTMTKFQTGNIVSVFYLVYATLQLVGGVMVDKYPSERFITIGLVGASVINLLIFFNNQNYIFTMIVWALNAVLQFGLYPAVFKISSSMLKESQRDTALFWVGFASPLGYTLSYLVAAIVPNWRYSFLISSVGLAFFAIVWVLVFRYNRHDLVEEGSVEMADNGTKETDKGFWRIAMGGGLILLCACTLLRTTFEHCFRNLTPTMIKECYDDVTPAFATVLNIAILLASTFGNLLARFLHKHVFKNEAKAAFVLLSCCLPLVAVTLFVGRVHYALLVVALSLFVWIASAAGFFSFTLICSRFGKWGKGGTLAGMLNSLGALGIVITNTVFTGVVEATSWWEPSVIWVAMMLLLLVMSAILVPIWTRFLRKHFN